MIYWGVKNKNPLFKKGEYSMYTLKIQLQDESIEIISKFKTKQDLTNSFLGSHPSFAPTSRGKLFVETRQKRWWLEIWQSWRNRSPLFCSNPYISEVKWKEDKNPKPLGKAILFRLLKNDRQGTLKLFAVLSSKEDVNHVYWKWRSRRKNPYAGAWNSFCYEGLREDGRVVHRRWFRESYFIREWANEEPLNERIIY